MKSTRPNPYGWNFGSACLVARQVPTKPVKRDSGWQPTSTTPAVRGTYRAARDEAVQQAFTSRKRRS